MIRPVPMVYRNGWAWWLWKDWKVPIITWWDYPFIKFIRRFLSLSDCSFNFTVK